MDRVDLTPACACVANVDEDRLGYCPVHVSCDHGCGALKDPQTKDELRAALDHWKHHGWLSGCSHGC